MKYYLISQEDAVALGVLDIRRGNEKGYIVNEGDLAVSKEIAGRAVEMSHSEAIDYIHKNNV